MSRTNIEKLSLLKKGDTVLVYTDDTRQYEYKGIEHTVSSITKDAIYVKDNWDRRYKFSKDGYGEYSRKIFPGSKDELTEYREFLKYKNSVKEMFDRCLKFLTKEEVDKIMEIINK